MILNYHCPGLNIDHIPVTHLACDSCGQLGLNTTAVFEEEFQRRICGWLQKENPGGLEFPEFNESSHGLPERSDGGEVTNFDTMPAVSPVIRSSVLDLPGVRQLFPTQRSDHAKRFFPPYSSTRYPSAAPPGARAPGVPAGL